MAQASNKLSLDQVIVKVTDMVSYDNNANKLAKNAGLHINYVSWEDCARDKNSCWGPCISDMTLRVNESCMPVIREPNDTDKTWDVEMSKIPIVIGNHTLNTDEALQTISLKDYLSNFTDFMTNDYYTKTGKQIDLTSQKENKDTHIIMSSQACFLPIQSGQETKFNVALYNYQSTPINPAVLVIISTSKGSSAQIIQGTEQYLLFNNNGKKADFVGERVSDHRKKKGQKNIHYKKLSKQEKQDNCIVVVQVPLKQKVIPQNKVWSALCYEEDEDEEDCDDDGWGDDCFDFNCAIQRNESVEEKANVEAAIVRVAERTKPVCICNKELKKYQVQFAYGGKGGVSCDECGVSISEKTAMVYHCVDGKNNYKHSNGYDLCLGCGEKQLQFDELRGLLNEDKDYVLERDERYPVRVTLQYYKATDNGVVNKEIMDEIVKQLETSQKQADYMGSLVTEYNPHRPSEWVNQDDMKMNDEYKEIRKALKDHGGKDWQEYFKNFENEEVKDSDLDDIGDEDLKELIPKIGPRNRFKKWMNEREQVSIQPVFGSK